MSRSIQSLCVLCLASVVTAAVGPAALASGGVMPIAGGEVLLGYGASYPGGTHRGVDVSGGAGAEVRTPISGVVTFAGSIPADGGGTCVAVTLETAEGLKVTLLPLEAPMVTVGDALCAGDVTGVLRASGDDSSADPHVHLSLRRGDAYLDPGVLLPVGGTSVPAPVPESAVVSPPVAPPSVSVAPVVLSGAAASTASVTAIPAAEVPVASAAGGALGVSAAGARAACDARLVPEAGIPVASALDPGAARPRVRSGASVAIVPARTAVGGTLLAAMVATGIAIVRVRRTACVRAY